MIKRYCFDTSGITNPLESMPADIHGSMWAAFRLMVEHGLVAATAEIYAEMCHIIGPVGQCLTDCKSEVLLEVGDPEWDWKTYLQYAAQMQVTHQEFISEYGGNGSAKTICLNDITSIALAKTLKIPVVSMEAFVKEDPGTKKRRIPNICKSEGVEHLTFNDFLRREKLSF